MAFYCPASFFSPFETGLKLMGPERLHTEDASQGLNFMQKASECSYLRFHATEHRILQWQKLLKKKKKH